MILFATVLYANIQHQFLMIYFYKLIIPQISVEEKKLMKFVLVTPKDTNMLQKSLREEELAVLQRRNVWYMVENMKKQCVVRSRVMDAKNMQKVRKTAVFNRKQPFFAGPSGETRLHLRRKAQIEDRLGLALAGVARPRRI